VGKSAIVPERTVNCFIMARGSGDSAGEQEFQQRVIEMLNGTANAAVHRDRLVTVEVEKALDRVAGLNLLVDEPFGPLLEMALGVTQSAGAALFLLDAANREPLLAATSESTAGSVTLGSRQLPVLPDGTQTAGSHLATLSYHHRRALLVPSQGPKGTAPRTSWLSLDGRDVPYEIAVPVPAAPGGGSTPNAGVIVLCRDDASGGQPYGSYELALLRNVALRLALLRTSLMMDTAGWAISAAARGYAFAEDPSEVVREAGGLWTGSLEPAAVNGAPDVADDLAEALEGLLPVVEFTGRVTGSSVASLRLLVQPEGARADADPVLRRVISWPAWRVADDGVDLTLTEPCVNSWVATTGSPCNLADVRDERSFLPYRGLRRAFSVKGRSTRAELCMPISVDGKILGTLNLESNAINAFALLDNVAAAGAAQVALRVASVRRRHLSTVLSIGSDVTTGAHELAGLASHLRGKAKGQETDGEARRVLSVLDQVMGALKPHQPEPQGAGTNSIKDVVVRAADAAHLPIRLRPSMNSTRVDWDEDFSRRVYLALFEVFRNADTHGVVRAPAGIPVIYANSLTLGGRTYRQVRIQQALKLMVRPNVRQLYRAPVRGKDRLHIGAFTAGAILRSLGGDAFAFRTEDRGLEVMVTVVTLPEEAGGLDGGR
jgi:hypothetical protein